MTVQTIVNRVRSAIDELMQNDSQLLNKSNDELNLTDVIIDKIGYALRHVLENAPLDKLGNDAYKTLTSEQMSSLFSKVNIGTQSDPVYMGRLVLPSDFLRIIEARLSSWSLFPLPVPDTSQVYLMQQDQYARGSWDRPVNVLTWDASNKRILEMYCAKDANDTLVFFYVALPDLTNVDASHPTQNVSVPSQLEASLIYQIAGLTMTAFREDIAGQLFAISQKYLDPEQTDRSA